MKRQTLSLILIAMALSLQAQPGRSAKRGIGWDEKGQPLSNAVVEKMEPGISWLYNWGVAPTGNATAMGFSDGMNFAPMCWNAGFNETRLRQWLNEHPDTEWLLGFNEPNFSSQANMTPQEAANAWPRLEQIALDYGLKLASPALNFSGERVGERVWSPYEWLDEFLRLYPEARLDAIALHCYMNWYGSNTWFATEYFFDDLRNPDKKDVYGKYPHIVSHWDTYGEPQVLLTEFCAWENDGTIGGLDFQLDQMTQKVQKLEQSARVAGYAWFMGNATATAYPYFSVFQTNQSSSELSTLGKVYVNMSSFDTSYYHVEEERIAAVNYVDASTDDAQIKLRPSTDTSAGLPLEISRMPYGGYASWQIDLSSDGDYELELRLLSQQDVTLWWYVDGKRQSPALSFGSTGGKWDNRSATLHLPAGRHTLMLFSLTSSDVRLSWLTIHGLTSGIANETIAAGDMNSQPGSSASVRYFTTDGREVSSPQAAHGEGLGILIEQTTDSNLQKHTRKIIVK